jgi:flavin reductase (DIM6/NTAB) family NADH-FMN oxidoreductase RutF
VPALADAAFVAWCRVTDRLPAGDHVLFVGEVVAFVPVAGEVEPPPLMRHQRRYVALGASLTDAAPEGYPT